MIRWHLTENRDLAAEYRGEAMRILFQLQNILKTGDLSVGAMNRTYPDGTFIHARVIPGMEMLWINSPFPKPVAAPVGIMPEGDIIIFYVKDGLKRIAIYDTRILDVDYDQADSVDYLAGDFDITFNLAEIPIIAKRFNYTGLGDEKYRSPMWFIRMPFTFAGDPNIGHYFFKGFSPSAPVDYIFVEKTAKFYLLESDVNAGDPFNVGNFIYTMTTSGTKYLRAFSFNFETETVTKVKEKHSGYEDEIKYLDQEGNGYYKGNLLYLENRNDPWHAQLVLDGYVFGNIGWYMADYVLGFDTFLYFDFPDDAFQGFDLAFSSYSQYGTLSYDNFGNWEGSGRSDIFLNDGPGGIYQQHNLTIPLYDLLKYNIWTETESTATGYAKSYEATPEIVETRQFLSTLHYKHYLDTFPKVQGEALVMGVVDEEVDKDYGEPTKSDVVTYQDPPTNHLGQMHKNYAVSHAETKKILGKITDGTIESSGSLSLSAEWHAYGMGHYWLLSSFEFEWSAEVTQDLIDFTSDISILAFPFGSDYPFYTRRVKEQTRSLSHSQSWDTKSTIYDDPGAAYVKSLITPYDETVIGASDSVSGWMHLDGNNVLVQSLIATGGDRIYSQGIRWETIIAAKLGVNLSAIYGMIYLPDVTDNDEEYKEKVAGL